MRHLRMASSPSDRVDSIKNFPIPSAAKELRCALGLLNWFRKYIPNYSIRASPLHALLKKNVKFVCTQFHTDAFQTLKEALINSNVYSFPKYDLPFRIAVDTSSRGIGYMLNQKVSISGRNRKIVWTNKV